MFNKTMLAVVAGALGFAGAAQGAVISNNYSFSSALISTGPSVSVAPFDTSLGTLTKVEVVTSGAAKAVVTFFNFSGVIKPFSSAQTSGPVSLLGPGVSVPVTVSVSGLSGSLNAGTSEQLFPDPGSGTSLADDFVFLPGDPIPAAYTGGSPIPFSLTDGSFSSSASFSGPVFVGGDAVGASVGLNVIYTYTPVPEPASLGLLGLGALGLMRRRRTA